MIYIAIAVAVVVIAIILYKRKKGGKEVPQGLQVLDANNDVVYDTNTNMTRFIERRQLFGTGTLTLEELGHSGTNLFVIMVTSPYYKAGYKNPPDIVITITNTSLTWVNVPSNTNDGIPATVLLGVY